MDHRQRERWLHENAAHGFNRHSRTQRPYEEGLNAEYAEDLFFNTFAFGATFAAGASKPVNLQIQADSDFEWIKTTWNGFLDGQVDTASTAVYAPFTCFITDTGSGRQLMSAPVPLSSICGDGKLPFINPVKRLFKANATVTMTLVSLSAAQWDQVFVTMIGRKIFHFGK